MPSDDHNPVVPDQSAITAFLKAIGLTGPDAAAKAANISYHTAAKWYLAKPAEMTAVNLLRLVIAIDADEQLVNQIREWRAANAQRHAASGLVTRDGQGATPVRRVAEPDQPAPAVRPRGGAKGRGPRRRTG